MDINRNITESMAVLGVIHSASQGTGTVNTTNVNTALHRRVRFRVDVGVVGASGTVNFQIAASATSGGTYTVVPNTAIVAITTSNNIAEVEIRAINLQSLGVGPWIQGQLAIGVAASQVSVTVDGTVDRYEPASDNNIAGVATPVVL